MTTPDEQAPGPQTDPQTHVDTDPVNNPETDLAGNPRTPADTESRTDSEADPAHHAGGDEGWESEGGATPSGPVTDT
jgi:hypothetical protein